jgi:hypothetical protein
MGIAVLRIETNCPAVVRHSAVGIALANVDVPALDVGLGVFWVDTDRLIVVR